ncbi:MAG: DUF2442 domain-containing protein [Parabacteroides sp.]|nr:DUF2442 domain-containing protein [Parabacteroides sp.]
MNDNILLTVLNAEYVRDYILRIRFSNGVEKLFDFSTLLSKGICRKLQNLDYFKQFTIDPFTVDWNNEIGFAPEYLYENGITI